MITEGSITEMDHICDWCLVFLLRVYLFSDRSFDFNELAISTTET